TTCSATSAPRGRNDRSAVGGHQASTAWPRPTRPRTWSYSARWPPPLGRLCHTAIFIDISEPGRSPEADRPSPLVHRTRGAREVLPAHTSIHGRSFTVGKRSRIHESTVGWLKQSFASTSGSRSSARPLRTKKALYWRRLTPTRR